MTRRRGPLGPAGVGWVVIVDWAWKRGVVWGFSRVCTRAPGAAAAAVAKAMWRRGQGAEGLRWGCGVRCRTHRQCRLRCQLRGTQVPVPAAARAAARQPPCSGPTGHESSREAALIAGVGACVEIAVRSNCTTRQMLARLLKSRRRRVRFVSERTVEEAGVSQCRLLLIVSIRLKGLNWQCRMCGPGRC